MGWVLDMGEIQHLAYKYVLFYSNECIGQFHLTWYQLAYPNPSSFPNHKEK
jgi:hypothetical protein